MIQVANLNGYLRLIKVNSVYCYFNILLKNIILNFSELNYDFIDCLYCFRICKVD
jgi:hypothetical protein